MCIAQEIGIYHILNISVLYLSKLSPFFFPLLLFLNICFLNSYYVLHTILNKRDMAGPLILDFRRNDFRFSHSVWFWVWIFVTHGFYQFEVRSHTPFSRVFIMKGCWGFLRGFFCTHWENHLIFILDSINVVYYTLISMSCTVFHFYIPVIKLSWWLCKIILMISWILFAHILLR